MLKKIDSANEFLKNNSDLFECPWCHARFDHDFRHKSLRCDNGHVFDLSSKGTLYFLKRAVRTKYDREMFTSRREMIRSGMYRPLIDRIQQYVEANALEQSLLLDLGSGEGSFLQEMSATFPGRRIGLDISKDGIYMSSDHRSDDLFWCVADLTNLPFADRKFDVALNILSPVHYDEIFRVLKPGAPLIKVIPSSGYLRELREALYDDEKKNYSNELVMHRLSDECAIREKTRVSYVFELPEIARHHLSAMTPLEWSARAARLDDLRKNPLSRITIDVEVSVCLPQRKGQPRQNRLAERSPGAHDV